MRQFLRDGTKVPGGRTIKPVSRLYRNVAMDIVFLTGISQANVAALHKAGVKVNGLGYKTLPKGYKRPAAPSNPFLESVIPGVTGGN